MHRKGAQDARRAKKFARLIKELQVAARGSVDPQNNPRLRTALLACKSANMPKDNIEKVLNKAKSGDQDNLEEVRYEGYGPGGIAILVEAVTDNRNRTASEVRSSFTKYGGNLGETGSVSYLFKNVGQIIYKTNIDNKDELVDLAIEYGAIDLKETETIEILCAIENFNFIRDTIEKKFGLPEIAEIVWLPENIIEVDEEQAKSLIRLLHALDNCDDVQNVFGNFNIEEDLINKLNV